MIGFALVALSLEATLLLPGVVGLIRRLFFSVSLSVPYGRGTFGWVDRYMRRVALQLRPLRRAVDPFPWCLFLLFS